MKCFENTIMHNCLKRKCGNTTPQSCPKENILRIQFRRIASKEKFWEYNSIELLQRSIVEIHHCRVALKQNVGIQLRRVVLQWIFWEYNSSELPQRDFCIIRLWRVVLKEIFWKYNFVELPQRESVGKQLRKVAPKECLVRMQFRRIASKRMLLDATSAKCFRKNVLVTLTRGHNFDLGFLTQGQIWFLTWGQFFIYLFFNLDDDSRLSLDFWFRVEFWFS